MKTPTHTTFQPHALVHPLPKNPKGHRRLACDSNTNTGETPVLPDQTNHAGNSRTFPSNNQPMHKYGLLLIITFLTLLRWLWNVGAVISPEAAYLSLCGSTPAIAYFDGPPGTALCTALGTAWAGNTALGAQLLWPLFAALATAALYFLVKPLSNERAAFSLAILLNLLPAFNTASLSPNAALPVAALSLAALACVWRALNSNAPTWWIAFGFCTAAALLFSYVAALLVPAVLLILLTSRRWRRHFLTAGFWAALALPTLLATLFIIWNSRHGWVHFIGGTWQTALTLHSTQFLVASTATTHAASPLIVVALAGGLAMALRHIRYAPKAKFLVIPALIALAASLYASLTQSPSQAIGLSALVLALPLLIWLPHVSTGTTDKKVILQQCLSAPIFFTAVFLTSGLATFFALSRLPTPRNIASVPVVREIEILRTNTPSNGQIFLIAENAALASAVGLHLRNTSAPTPGHPPVYVVESPYANSQYALWPRYDEIVETLSPPSAIPGMDVFTEQKGVNPFLGKSAFYITTQKPDELPQAITAAFGTHRLLAEITAEDGEILRVFFCEDYQMLPL